MRVRVDALWAYVVRVPAAENVRAQPTIVEPTPYQTHIWYDKYGFGALLLRRGHAEDVPSAGLERWGGACSARR